MLNIAYGDNTMKKTAIFKRVSEAHENCKDDGRPRCPPTIFDDQIIKRIQSLDLPDRRMTVRILANMLNIRKLSIHTILIKKNCVRLLSDTKPKAETKRV